MTDSMKKYILAVLTPLLFTLPLHAQTDRDNPYLLCEDTCAHVHGIDLSCADSWRTSRPSVCPASRTLSR